MRVLAGECSWYDSLLCFLRVKPGDLTGDAGNTEYVFDITSSRKVSRFLWTTFCMPTADWLTDTLLYYRCEKMLSAEHGRKWRETLPKIPSCNDLARYEVEGAVNTSASTTSPSNASTSTNRMEPTSDRQHAATTPVSRRRQVYTCAWQ